MKLLAFGEVLWDVYPTDKYIGGAPLNFAAHFVKNGHQASMLSAVGNDELGTITIDTIHQWQVDTTYVASLNHRETGKCLVTLNDKGIPSYHLLSDVAYDEVPVPQIKEIFDVFYFGTLALRTPYNLNTVKEVLNNNTFKEIFVDMNIRPPHYSKESISFALNHATMIKISDEELPVVLKEIGWQEETDLKVVSQQLQTSYPQLKVIIITCGEKGSFVYTNNETYRIDAKKVEVASTVGAGDSFSAAFLASYLNNQPIMNCLDMATKVSAFVVSKTDAIPEYTIEDLI